MIFLVSSCDKTHEFPDTVKDIDGNVYKTVLIGSQLWMKENLRTTRYSDGSSIPNVINFAEWEVRFEDGFCWYRNDTTFKEMGALYNYYAVIDPRNVCPEGWHVSSNNEWEILEIFLGLPFEDIDKTGMRGTIQGDMLKSTYGWLNSGNGNNITGFSAFPSGIRWLSGVLGGDEEGFNLEIGSGASFWAPTNNSPECRRLFYNKKGIGRGGGSQIEGLPIRCIKD